MHALAVVLFAAGVAVVVVSAVAVLAFREALDRLHLLTPTTTLGAPLVGLGLALDGGWTLPDAAILFSCLVLALTGPVIAAATTRTIVQRRGSVQPESPQ
ncbi:monovalent cation/H(+) antiporter subunit G [Nocardioides terrisoli]|uniref:monovalent cation/H(+) antiporter subunit G n=1 Tax=Nocardioides terrisoli TaxID=3388267 RepID=UPI00287B6137|nr:monovalent cation/H(+) antiporter subunit G [Nocardioides marmorisolisilvae]